MHRENDDDDAMTEPPRSRSYLGAVVNYVAGYLTPIVKVSSLSVFFFVAILTASLFAYVAFYQAVVPDIEFNMPVNFHYDTDCYLSSTGTSELRHCNFPTGNLSLFRASGVQLLSPGQEYLFSLQLEVPESDVNYQIGNFLVGVEVFAEENHKQYSDTVNVLLKYRSLIYSTMRTFFLLPLLMSGYVDQRQTLNIVFEKTFSESLFTPSHYLLVQVHSRYVQFYSASLNIQAQLRGIKWVLFAHPLLSGFVIVAILMGLFGMIVILSVAQRLYSSMSVTSPSQSRADDMVIADDVSETTTMASTTPQTASPSYSPSRPIVRRTSAISPASKEGESEANVLRLRSTLPSAGDSTSKQN